ncbi:MAG: type II secretion system F family protein, partial [Nitrososphaerota archaeon]|nr:type II secretion system F family protein [Nitrososphaerota archaeon]
EWLLWSATLLASLGMILLLISQAQTQVVLETDSTFIVAGLIASSLILAVSAYLLIQTFPSVVVRFEFPRRMRLDKTISITSLRSSIIPKIMTRLQSLYAYRRLADWMAESIENNVIRSGLIESPSFLAQKYLTAAALSTPIALAAGIAVAIYVSPLGILLIFFPILVAFIPRLSTTTRAQDRDSTTEKELGLFMIHAAGMQSSGQNIFESFRDIIKTDIFVQLKKEAMLLVRNVKLFAKGGPLEVLEEIGRTHPNRKMKDVLIGYVSEYRTGGDLASYLESTAEDSLRDEQFRWKMFSERVSATAEVITMLLMLFPALAAVMAVISPGGFGSTLMLIGILLSPLLAFALYAVSRQTQPGGFSDRITGDLRLAMIFGAGSAVAGAIAGLGTVPLFVLIFGGITLGYGIKSQIVIREIRELEKGMTTLLGDIAELRKLGFDLNGAMRRLVVDEAERRYSGALLSLMRHIRAQFSMNRRFGELEVRTPSWLVRYVFFMIAKLSESGGGTPSQIDKLRRFVSEITRSKREAMSSVKIFLLLAYSTPFVVFLMTSIIDKMTVPFSGTAHLPILTAAPLNPVLIQALAASATISIVFALMKSIDLTIHNTTRIAIACILIIAAFYVVPSIVGGFSFGTGSVP